MIVPFFFWHWQMSIVGIFWPLLSPVAFHIFGPSTFIAPLPELKIDLQIVQTKKRNLGSQMKIYM